MEETKRPLQAPQEFGLLDAHHVMLAHCNWPSDEEMDTPRMTPLLGSSGGNLPLNLGHAVQGGHVDMTMVAGRIVVENGRLLSVDLAQTIMQANRAVPPLFERRARWLRKHERSTRIGSSASGSFQERRLDGKRREQEALGPIVDWNTYLTLKRLHGFQSSLRTILQAHQT